jgi:tetratricopeptide (TPR) repeat protein
MAKLFLSYSRKDTAWAQRLAAWCERNGHDVWRDQDDIGGGASFSSEIEKALNDCGAVLVLWSASSVTSPWVRDEAAYGRDAGKLIPLSLDKTLPPLGFRQFQSIDLSRWRGRGPPPDSARISDAIARIAGTTVQAHAASARSEPRARARGLIPLIGALALVMVLGVAGVLASRHFRSDAGVTIEVSASPVSANRAIATDYANVAAADMAGYLPARFPAVKIIGPAEARNISDRYRLQISANGAGTAADATVTLGDRDGSSIIWSKSWNVPDTSKFDLRQQVSLAASQAATCLIDARGGPRRLEQPALGSYILACTGLNDPSVSLEQVNEAMEQVIKLAPDFPRGWSAVSLGRSIEAEKLKRAGQPDGAARRSAWQAIATARKIDPHGSLSDVAEWHLDLMNPLAGVMLLDRAAAIDPDEPVVQVRRSTVLLAVGRLTDAVEAAHRGTELNPLWSFMRAGYIDALAHAGLFERAKSEIADAHRKWPLNAEIDQADFNFELSYGDPGTAEQLMPRALNRSEKLLAPYRKLLAARRDPTPGKIGEAIATLRETAAIDPQYVNTELVALGLFGRVDEAFSLLGQVRFLPHLDLAVLFRPELAAVRSDRRFMPVAARLGLVSYWRRSGNWPDFCGTEKLDYDCKVEASKYSLN